MADADEGPRAVNGVQKALAAIRLWQANHPGKPLDPADTALQAHRLLAMERLSALQAGDIDPWLGLRVHTIVRKSTLYVIYLDQDLRIQWWWVTRPTGQDEKVLAYVQAQVTRLQHESDFLRLANPLREASVWWGTRDARPTPLDRERAENIRALVAESMMLAFNGGRLEECERLLQQAETQIMVAKDQLCRPAFFRAALVPIALLAISYVAMARIWPCDAAASLCVPPWVPFVRDWHDAALAGAIGALTSAMLRSNELKLEPHSQRQGIRVDAWARITIGAVAGVMATWAFSSGLFMKEAIVPDGREALRLLLSLAAGASERMLPSLFGRAEGLLGVPGAETPARPGTGLGPGPARPSDRLEGVSNGKQPDGS